MKVYVDELPKRCNECPCCSEQDFQINSEYCEMLNEYVDNMVENKQEFRPKECPLQSLSDYTKQVRKEVVQEIIEEVKKLIDKDFKLCNHEYANGYCYGLQYDLAKILEQIEKGETK